MRTRAHTPRCSAAFTPDGLGSSFRCEHRLGHGRRHQSTHLWYDSQGHEAIVKIQWLMRKRTPWVSHDLAGFDEGDIQWAAKNAADPDVRTAAARRLALPVKQSDER